MTVALKPQRGRPKQDGLADRRRKQIVESAFEVLAERGYEGTTIAVLGRHAGVGQGTVYRYFKNKREILDHVFDFAVEKLFDTVDTDRVGAPVDSLAEFVANVEHLGDGLFGLMRESPALLKLVLVDAVAIDDEMTQRVAGLQQLIVSMLASALDHGKLNGWVREGVDSRLISVAMVALALPGILRGLQGSLTPEAERRYGSGIVDLLVRGVGVRGVGVRGVDSAS